MGNRYFHSSVSNWSIRRRGNVHLNHMMINTITALFPRNQKIAHVLRTGENEVQMDEALRAESKKPLEKMLDLAK